MNTATLQVYASTIALQGISSMRFDPESLNTKTTKAAARKLEAFWRKTSDAICAQSVDGIIHWMNAAMHDYLEHCDFVQVVEMLVTEKTEMPHAEVSHERSNK